MKSKILSLNLVLLMIFMTMQPVFAEQYGFDKSLDTSYEVKDEQEASVDVSDDFMSELADSSDIDQCIEKLNDIKNAKSDHISMYSNSSPYLISINSNYFMSNQDKSGVGWSYIADEHALILDDYYGSAITASGDLDIYVKNDAVIRGNSGTQYGIDTGYGDDGIVVLGDLVLYIDDGKFDVYGGEGSKSGGDAVKVKNNLLIAANNDTKATFTGGKTTNARFGGYALYAQSSVTLIGSRNSYVTAVGGAVPASISNGYGGFGICSGDVYVAANSTINGGSANLEGHGIHFGDTCEFSAINSHITGGTNNPDGGAIENIDDKKFVVSKHVDVSGNIYDIYIKVKQYTLKLMGNGGSTADGRTQMSFTDYYPASYPLAEYAFQRTGYTQVGWESWMEGDDRLMPLNKLYVPASPTQLTAYWVKTDAGDILLNGLDGKFSDGKFYKKDTSGSTKLPESLTYTNDKLILLGWCDEPDSDSLETDSYVYSGKWYSAGTEIMSEPSKASVIYGRAADQGIIYHPTKGSVKNGGNIIVQGEKSTSSSDSAVKIVGADRMIAPDGYKFVGWSVSEDSNVVRYEPGDEITLKSGALYNLYAVWNKTIYTYSPENGIAITYRPDDKNITVTMTSDQCSKNNTVNAVCALYRNGKQIASGIQKYSYGNSLNISVDYYGEDDIQCKVFATDAKWKSVQRAISCNISDIISKDK